MEIGVHVAAENSFSGDTRHVVSAYLTFVALDKNGRPIPVPVVLPETDVEQRRFDAAEERRNARLEMRDARKL
jgi:acyl-CoA hydrolase